MAKLRKVQLDRVCFYCENAVPLHDKDFMLCRRHGVVSAGHRCRRFSYDPLKRVPMPRKRLDSDSDLKLPELP